MPLSINQYVPIIPTHDGAAAKTPQGGIVKLSETLTVGDKILLFRQAKDWKQSDLAEMVGISLGALASYETGRREPRSGILERIADAFGVSVKELYDERWDEVREAKRMALAKVEEILAEGDKKRGAAAEDGELRGIYVPDSVSLRGAAAVLTEPPSSLADHEALSRSTRYSELAAARTRR